MHLSTVKWTHETKANLFDLQELLIICVHSTECNNSFQYCTSSPVISQPVRPSRHCGTTDGMWLKNDNKVREACTTSSCFIACCKASNCALVIMSPFSVAGTAQTTRMLFRIANREQCVRKYNMQQNAGSTTPKCPEIKHTYIINNVCALFV